MAVPASETAAASELAGAPIGGNYLLIAAQAVALDVTLVTDEASTMHHAPCTMHHAPRATRHVV